MFESLDSIDWGSLDGCYRSAGEMPHFLRSCQSVIPEIRERAIEEIGSAAFHQGTVYPVSAMVVPFLFELLENEDVQDKEQVVCLLSAMARCCPYLETNVASAQHRSQIEAELRKKGETFEEALQRERELVQSVRSQIAKRLDLIYPYLRSSNEFGVRLAVAEALCEFPDFARRLRPDLERILESEEHEDVRNVIAYAMTTK